MGDNTFDSLDETDSSEDSTPSSDASTFTENDTSTNTPSTFTEEDISSSGVEPGLVSGASTPEPKAPPTPTPTSNTFGIDPRFIKAVATVESNNNPKATGTPTRYGTAKGEMQIIDSTFKGIGKELGEDSSQADPYDKATSERYGSKLISDLQTQFGNDPRLIAAAYNSNPKLVKYLQGKYGDSYENIESHLPEETRKYVPKVLNAFKSEIGTDETNNPSQDINALAQGVSRTKAGFAQAIMPVISDPAFDSLPFSEKANRIATLYNAKSWMPEVNDLVKQTMTEYWNAADPKELPNLNEIVTPPPRLNPDDKPDATLAKWKTDQKAQIRQTYNINPAMFGNALDEYLDSAASNESQAFEYRNRSIFGSVKSEIGNAAREIGIGGASSFTNPVAGVARLANKQDLADSIQGLPEKLLGKPPRDFMYATDENGYLLPPNPDGSLKTKWQADALQTVGQVATFIAGGEGLKALGIGTKVIGSTFFAGNALSNANESFKEVYDNTKDLSKAYTAAFSSIPAAALGSIGELGVVSKWANPAIAGLEDFSKAKYLGQVFAKNTAIGALGIGAQDAATQSIEDAQTGKAFSLDRLKASVIGGGLGAGVAGTFGSRHVQGAPDKVQPSTGSGEAPVKPLGLPAPERLTELAGPDRKGLPAPAGEKPFELSGPTVGPETSRTIFGQASTDNETRANLFSQLENFKKSQKSEASIPADLASQIPPEMFQVFDLVPSSDGLTAMLYKGESYYPVDANDPETLQKHIDNLSTDLESHPSPTQDNVIKLQSERRSLKREYTDTVSTLGQDLVDAVNNRKPLQAALDTAKAQLEDPQIQSDRTLRRIAQSDINEKEAALSNYDDTHKELYAAPNRVGELLDQIKENNRKLKLISENVNDVKAKERNLNYLKTKLDALNSDALSPENKARKDSYDNAVKNRQETLNNLGIDNLDPKVDLSRGVKVEDQYVLPHGDKWYVLDNTGDLVGGAHDYFYDAAESIKARNRGEEPLSTQFVTKGTKDRTALNEKDLEGISKSLETDKQVRANKANQEIEGQKAYEKEYQKEVAARLEAVNKEKVVPNEAPTSTKKRSKKGTSLSENDLGLTDTGITSSTDTEATIPKDLEAPKSSPTTRRRLSSLNPGKKLTSNYTPKEDFAPTSSKMVRASQIFDKLQNVLKGASKNTKVFFGGSVPNDVRGYFRQASNFIKVASHQDVPAAIHEVTHALDNTLIGNWSDKGLPDYAWIPKEVQNAVIDQAETYYPGMTPSDNTVLKLKEGFAMGIQHELTGQPVRKEFHNWFNTDFAEKFPDVYKQLQDVKSVVSDYYKQDSSTYQLSTLEPKKNATLTKLKNYSTLHNLNYEWLNTGEAIKRFDKLTGGNAYDVWEAQRGNSRGQVQSILRTGKVNSGGKLYQTYALKEAFEPAKAQGHMKELFAYLDARSDQGDILRGKLTKSNEEDIRNVIQNTNDNLPDVVKAANNYYDIVKTIQQVAHDASRESAYVIDREREANEEAGLPEHGYYIPRQREGKEGFKATLNRKGSTRSAVDFLSNIEDAFSQRLELAEKSKLKEKLIDDGTSPTLSDAGLMLRELTGSKKAEAQKNFEHEANASSDGGLDSKDLPLASYFIEPTKAVSGTEFKSLVYNDGGNLRFFETDPNLIKSLSSTLPEYVNSFWYKYLLRPSAQILRPAATTYRLAFQLKHLVRGPPDVWRYVNTGEGGWKDLISVYAHTFNELKNIALNKSVISPWAKQSGLHFATQYGAAQDVYSQMRKQYGENFLDFGHRTIDRIEQMLSVADTAARNASVALTAKKLGITDFNNLTPGQSIELINAWKRGRTNYSIQGDTARVINQLVPFFTANIAETSRLPADIKRSPGRMAALGTAMLSYGLYHALSHQGEEWYDEMPIDAKMNAAWFKTNVNGTDYAFYVPLDKWSAMTFGMGQAIGNKMSEDPSLPYSYRELAAAYTGRNLAPVNSLTDLATPLGREILEQFGNYDTYSKRSIVPPSLQYTDPRFQYTERTSELSKTIGNLLNESPLRVEHAIHGIAPAADDADQFLEKALGIKDDKETQSMNFLLRAFARQTPASAIYDRSQQAFTDKLFAARENKPDESPEEAGIRKKLEKVNKNVSDLHMFINGTDDKELRESARQKIGQELKLGLLVASGAQESVSRVSEHSQAQTIRKEKKKTLQAEVKNRKASDETPLKGDSGD